MSKGQKTRKAQKAEKAQKVQKGDSLIGVAVFRSNTVVGDVLIKPSNMTEGVEITATFTKLPPGKHGFHIHNAGDLRGEGCQGACSHYHVGVARSHGSAPKLLSNGQEEHKNRHTGDLGNIELDDSENSMHSGHYTYILKGITVKDLLGRSFIVHADEDDLGLGDHEDSKTTGHSGARIACAIIGRTLERRC